MNSGNFSGHFGGQGSRLNTKRNAQLNSTKAGAGNQLITPKVKNMSNDPEMHRKLLEKMFQTVGAEEGPALNVTAGGAFTKKGESGQKDDPSKKAGSGSSNEKPFVERDSIGLFYANPMPES